MLKAELNLVILGKSEKRDWFRVLVGSQHLLLFLLQILFLLVVVVPKPVVPKPIVPTKSATRSEVLEYCY